MCPVQPNAPRIRLSLLLIGVILFALPLAQSHALVLKIATVSPDGAMWMTKMREGAVEIAGRTQGRVTFKFYPGGIMGNDQSVLRKMRIGQLQGGAFPAGSLARRYADIQIYSLPFLFSTQSEVDSVRARMDDRLMQGLERHGLVGFGFAGGGFAYIMSTAPQKSIQEFRKHKVWVPVGDTIGRAVIQEAGASPIPLSLSDVLTGLQTGMIDTVATSPVAAIAFQWHTKVTYLTDVPISYIYALLAIDKKAFNKIRPADQQIVRQVMNRVYRQIDRQNRMDNEKARQALRRQGVTFVKPSAASLVEWKAVAAKAVDRLGRQGEFTPAMLSTLRGYLRQ